MAYNIYQDIIANTSNNCAIEDKIDFNAYYNGEIEIDECFRRFMERYSYKRITNLLDIYTDEGSFKLWLNSLGYRRYYG